MLVSLTIGKRIGLGFGLMLAFLLALGTVSFLSVTILAHQAEAGDESNKLNAKMADVEVAHLKWVDKVSSLMTDNSITELKVETDDHKCTLGQWLYGQDRKHAEADLPEIAPLLKEIEGHHAGLHASAVAIKQHFRRVDEHLPAILAQREIDHLIWADKVKTLLLENSPKLEVQTDPHKCAFGLWLDSQAGKATLAAAPELAKLVDACREPHARLHASAIAIQQVWDPAKPEAHAAVKEILTKQTLPALAEVRKGLEACRAYATEQVASLDKVKEIFATQTKANLANVQKTLGEVRKRIQESVAATNVAVAATETNTKRTVMAASLLAVVIGIVVASLIRRGVVKPLKRAIDELTGGADQVNGAAAQVSATSQQLAENTTRQASSLQESSSAIEQMSAMTRTTADNARQAKEISDQTNGVAQEGGKTVAQLTEAMAGINASSEQISKIIKVIEEIAFQTNLLALNAAVEAARAGEHGKGFAVVADEVRNLAQRAATAARETTGLIERSVNNARAGSQVAGEVGKVLTAIISEVGRTSELVSSIAQATEQQSQGTEQISTAVSDMDRVTQQNAGSAEQSAAAAEELAAQAEAVKGVVGTLVTMVG